MKKNKLVFGVGINDADHPVTVDGKNIKSYQVWKDMIRRCYSQEFLTNHPTYIGCSVCQEWLVFSNFKKFFDENYVEDYQLDKDLLDKDNREYGPDKCLFVPQRINLLATDRGASRGEYPIGVSHHKRTKKFQSRVDDGTGKQKHLGYFSTPEAAHLAYIIAKREIIEDLKTELDTIHPDLYEAILSRYPLPKPANDPLHWLQAA